MKSEMTINNTTVELVSNALTPILYRQIFKKDFLKEMSGLTALKGKKAEDFTEDDLEFFASRQDAIPRLAFVMAKQAETKDVKVLVELSLIDYYCWLSDYETQAFMDSEVIGKVIGLWAGNANDSHIESKN